MFSYLFVGICNAHIAYGCQDLIAYGFQCKQTVTNDFQRIHNIPEDMARSPRSPWIVVGSSRQRRWRKERKQKRGCRVGLFIQLRKQPFKPLLPSIFLTNARSMTHKMEELELQIATNRLVHDCCVMIITETWLHTQIPDAAVQLTGRTIHRQDRNKDTGKSRGGGLCIFVHKDWCSNSNIIDMYCTPDLEALSVIC